MNRLIYATAVMILAALALSSPSTLADTPYTQKSNLPTLYIDTQNNAPIPSKDENYVRATIHLVDNGNVTVYDALGIRGRGNSTWGLAKKPYRIKFDKKQKFLGEDHANAKSWTLLANHADKTLLRNAVAACIGKFAGQPFTASAEFVDLVLNGKYIGNYQISDQIEVRKKRVDITEQDVPATPNSNITGGYLLEADGFAFSEKVFITTNRGVNITIKSPDDDIINQNQINYIRNYINEFEAALFSEDFTDPEKGYRKYVDASTLASWYISSELTGNVDCFWSTYFYKDIDDTKLYWGPLWDYDIAFNNCNRIGDVSQSLMLDRAFAGLTEIWVRRMWQDPWFAELINDSWTKLVENGIEQHVLDYIDDMAELMSESQRLNFNKWGISEHVYNELVLFSTYDEGFDYLKKFVSDHTRYLTDAFAQAAQNNTMPKAFEADPNYYYLIANKGCGMLANSTDGTNVTITDKNSTNDSRHWTITKQEDGFFTIVNRETGKAVSDAATYNGSTYAIGSNIVLSNFNVNDDRQHWSIVPAANQPGMGYVIANKTTGFAWNNSNGASIEGNPVISWLNNGDNPCKPTRQWLIVKSDIAESGINAPDNDIEYHISYDPYSATLHFIAHSDDELHGDASIVNIDGRVMMNFVPAESIDVSSLTKGMYILTWKIGSKTRTLKFVR